MRILFITSTRIGDAILSTGLLSYLIGMYPDARITVAAGPAAAPLFAAMPRLERTIVIRKQPGASHWATLWLQCIAYRWALVVDLRRSAIGWLLSARERRFPPSAGPKIHRVETLAATFCLENPPSPVCWTGPEDETLAKKLAPEGRPILAVAAAANWPGKQWRPERFAELVARLTGAGGILPQARVAVLAAAQERPQVQPVLAAIPTDRCLDLVGKTELPAAAAFLRRCAFFVGNDSGLMHMAAAVGTPTLGLFGPSRTAQFAPWGALTASVRTAKRYDEIVGAPGYDHRNTGTLMDSLSVDMAETAARGLWHRVVADSGPTLRRPA